MEIIVTYVLPPMERPTHPGRLWHGLVIGVQPWGVHVLSLDEGYEELEDFVPDWCIVNKEVPLFSIDSPKPAWYTRNVS
jgi:hypothetical protein